MATKKPTERAPMVFGYARVSTKHQRLDRQEQNIRAACPDVDEIVTEKFTGTKMDRPAWNRLYKKLAAGDTLIFDEVSRMSRDGDEGAAIYEELYTRGVNLVFLKQPLVNTDNYRQAAQATIAETGDEVVDLFIKAANKALIILAKRQIRQAFGEAQSEVEHLHKRVTEGMRASGASSKWREERDERGELISRECIEQGKIAKARTGNTYETRRSKEAKVRIRQMSKTFNGNMTDKDVMETLRLARNSYYKYKREILTEIDNEDIQED